ncbi:PHP domain-containing protein [Hominifimenecus sp. rT4P-3]|uniref:PHP domain-containing protein n=1 Tax=Hominifimenecus sp. rT4P-3 TaxID=3242979 RepID=UPI003DA4D7D9
MSEANFVCDLHGHTNRSDGNDTPAEFLQHAAARKMKIVAITDHDKIPPKSVMVDGREIDILEYADSLGLKLILGTEVSCETEIEEVHLVCFHCNWQAPFFRELDDFTVRSKVNSYKKLLERLDEMGMPMTWEEVLRVGGSPVPETEVQKKMIFNLMADKGYVSDWREAKLLVKRNPNLTIYRKKPAAADVIHEIHRQGGIVILAHPYLVGEEVDYHGQTIRRKDFIDQLIFEGLDGIEGRYTYDKTSYNGRMSKFEIYTEVVSQYGGRIPIISGGSDYHADGKKGVSDPRDIGECGLTESEFYRNPILAGLI